MTAVQGASSASVALAAGRAATQRVASQRGGLVVTGLFYLVVTAALSGVWQAAADANGGAVVGYSAVALVWYVATSETCIISIPARLIYETGEDIGSGAVAVEMLRPIPTVVVRVATQVGAALPRIVVCASIGAVFVNLIAGPPESAAALALAAPAVLLAVSANIAAQHAFASASFWIRDASTAWFLYQKMVFVIGGMLLPLEILPDATHGVLRLLPFASMAYAPARLASGHVEPELLAIQAFWLVALLGLASWAFAAGERRFTKVGF